MKNKAFVVGGLLSLINIALNIWMFMNGLMVLGVLLGIGTILVFASGIIWLIYQGDGRLHFRRGWLVIPLAVFGAAMVKVLNASPATFVATPEDLQKVGDLLITRYQTGLWLVSIVLFFVFIIAGSLMMRRRA